ncbi:KEOPS complex subunit Pcc1 [Haloarchaeobius sp. HME9146]|uniref:KEOPS complex subunit Pcc1 n=1 Tax=Haloarchaeobius sp. HME9146 TaxID=2978732 RepID=UPI0021C24373|nr:KEOPS complex subunit Pcc1 [Haloarchaeobius sp. HME9146]MCT9096072.1 KEOPS complex subunit Pcc1 [Haloarchaeobius sp. HME9146]
MSSFSHATSLEFEYDSDAIAKIVERSVAQEIGEIAGDRSSTTLSRTGDTVTVEVEAADLVALRAGINTWIRLVEVAEKIHDLGSGY